MTSTHQPHQRTRSSSIAPSVMLARTASRFLFDERGRKQIENDEWEHIYPSSSSAARALKTFVARKLLQVKETKKLLLGRKKPPRHWSDLAPHSATSVLASQIDHLNHLEALLVRVVNMCRELGDERHQSMMLMSGDTQQEEPTPLTSTAALSHNMSEESSIMHPTTKSLSLASSASSLSNVMVSMFSTSPTLVAMLRQVVATEEDLQRREAFARLSDWQQGDTLMMDSSAMAASVRNFSPLRQGRVAKQQAALQLFVRDLTDATSFIGRRMSAIRGAVDAWLWEGFDGEAIAERLSNFVDEIVTDVRSFDHHDTTTADAVGHRRTVGGGSFESLDGVPDEVLIAAIEDELYCYDAMYKVLEESLQEVEDDEVLDAQIALLRGATQGSLHVPELFQYHVDNDAIAGATIAAPYAKSIAMLKTIQLYRTPTRKLLVIKAASKQLLEEMKTAALANGAKEEKLIVGGDDFIPMFVYVTVKSGLPKLASEVFLLRHCMPRSLRHGELGYYSTTLEFACEFIKNMADAVRAPSPSSPMRSPLLQSTTSHAGHPEGEDTLDEEQLGRPLCLALADVPFARRWVSSGVVSFLGGNGEEGAWDTVACSGVAVNEELMLRRYRLLSVVCTSDTPSSSSSSPPSPPMHSNNIIVGGATQVQVVLIDISQLTSPQWALVSKAAFGAHPQVVLGEALTCNRGLRVVVPVHHDPGASSGPSWATYNAADAVDTGLHAMSGFVEQRTARARHAKFGTTFVSHINEAWDAAHTDGSWPIAAAPLSNECAAAEAIAKCQQILALFWGFAAADVDGQCCEETVCGVEALRSQHLWRIASGPATPTSTQQPQQERPSTLSLVEWLHAVCSTLVRCIRELQQQHLIPTPSLSNVAPTLPLEELMRAVRIFQSRSQIVPDGKLTVATLSKLLESK